jgi:hypothetical protein
MALDLREGASRSIYIPGAFTFPLFSTQHSDFQLFDSWVYISPQNLKNYVTPKWSRPPPIHRPENNLPPLRPACGDRSADERSAIC